MRYYIHHEILHTLWGPRSSMRCCIQREVLHISWGNHIHHEVLHIPWGARCSVRYHVHREIPNPSWGIINSLRCCRHYEELQPSWGPRYCEVSTLLWSATCWTLLLQSHVLCTTVCIFCIAAWSPLCNLPTKQLLNLHFGWITCNVWNKVDVMYNLK